MKTYLLLASLLFAPVALTPALAQTVPPAAASEPKSHKDKEETELGQKMEKMNRAYRKLRASLADPANNEASLKLVETLRALSVDSAKLTPAKAADIPAADRAKFQTNYEAKMKTFIGDLDKLTAALKAGKNEEAQKIFASFKAFQSESHKEFKKKKPDAHK